MVRLANASDFRGGIRITSPADSPVNTSVFANHHSIKVRRMQIGREVVLSKEQLVDLTNALQKRVEKHPELRSVWESWCDYIVLDKDKRQPREQSSGKGSVTTQLVRIEAKDIERESLEVDYFFLRWHGWKIKALVPCKLRESILDWGGGRPRYQLMGIWDPRPFAWFEKKDEFRKRRLDSLGRLPTKQEVKDIDREYSRKPKGKWATFWFLPYSADTRQNLATVGLMHSMNQLALAAIQEYDEVYSQVPMLKAANEAKTKLLNQHEKRISEKEAEIGRLQNLIHDQNDLLGEARIPVQQNDGTVPQVGFTPPKPQSETKTALKKVSKSPVALVAMLFGLLIGGSLVADSIQNAAHRGAVGGMAEIGIGVGFIALTLYLGVRHMRNKPQTQEKPQGPVPLQ